MKSLNIIRQTCAVCFLLLMGYVRPCHVRRLFTTALLVAFLFVLLGRPIWAASVPGQGTQQNAGQTGKKPDTAAKKQGLGKGSAKGTSSAEQKYLGLSCNYGALLKAQQEKEKAAAAKALGNMKGDYNSPPGGTTPEMEAETTAGSPPLCENGCPCLPDNTCQCQTEGSTAKTSPPAQAQSSSSQQPSNTQQGTGSTSNAAPGTAGTAGATAPTGAPTPSSSTPATPSTSTPTTPSSSATANSGGTNQAGPPASSAPQEKAAMQATIKAAQLAQQQKSADGVIAKQQMKADIQAKRQEQIASLPAKAKERADLNASIEAAKQKQRDYLPSLTQQKPASLAPSVTAPAAEEHPPTAEAHPPTTEVEPPTPSGTTDTADHTVAAAPAAPVDEHRAPTMQVPPSDRAGVAADLRQTQPAAPTPPAEAPTASPVREHPEVAVHAAVPPARNTTPPAPAMPESRPATAEHPAPATQVAHDPSSAPVKAHPTEAQQSEVTPTTSPAEHVTANPKPVAVARAVPTDRPEAATTDLRQTQPEVPTTSATARPPSTDRPSEVAPATTREPDSTATAGRDTATSPLREHAAQSTPAGVEATRSEVIPAAPTERSGSASAVPRGTSNRPEDTATDLRQIQPAAPPPASTQTRTATALPAPEIPAEMMEHLIIAKNERPVDGSSTAPISAGHAEMMRRENEPSLRAIQPQVEGQWYRPDIDPAHIAKIRDEVMRDDGKVRDETRVRDEARVRDEGKDTTAPAGDAASRRRESRTPEVTAATTSAETTRAETSADRDREDSEKSRETVDTPPAAEPADCQSTLFDCNEARAVLLPGIPEFVGVIVREVEREPAITRQTEQASEQSQLERERAAERERPAPTTDAADRTASMPRLDNVELYVFGRDKSRVMARRVRSAGHTSATDTPPAAQGRAAAERPDPEHPLLVEECIVNGAEGLRLVERATDGTIWGHTPTQLVRLELPTPKHDVAEDPKACDIAVQPVTNPTSECAGPRTLEDVVGDTTVVGLSACRAPDAPLVLSLDLYHTSRPDAGRHFAKVITLPHGESLRTATLQNYLIGDQRVHLQVAVATGKQDDEVHYFDCSLPFDPANDQPLVCTDMPASEMGRVLTRFSARMDDGREAQTTDFLFTDRRRLCGQRAAASQEPGQATLDCIDVLGLPTTIGSVRGATFERKVEHRWKRTNLAIGTRDAIFVARLQEGTAGLLDPQRETINLRRARWHQPLPDGIRLRNYRAFPADLDHAGADDLIIVSDAFNGSNEVVGLAVSTLPNHNEPPVPELKTEGSEAPGPKGQPPVTSFTFAAKASDPTDDPVKAITWTATDTAGNAVPLTQTAEGAILTITAPQEIGFPVVVKATACDEAGSCSTTTATVAGTGLDVQVSPPPTATTEDVAIVTDAGDATDSPITQNSGTTATPPEASGIPDTTKVDSSGGSGKSAEGGGKSGCSLLLPATSPW